MADSDTRDALLELRFVGPATADVLADAGVTAPEVESKAVSHADLVDAGVNPGVAAKIRREHSLQWSFEGGQDLDRRAEQVRGLHDDEREWVAASYGEEDASADGSGDTTAEEAAWRDQPSSTADPPESDGEGEWRRQSWPNEEDADAERGEVAWRERSKPTPVTVLEDVEDGDAKLLARAGITSIRSLATANVERTADSLGVPADLVAEWQRGAREREE